MHDADAAGVERRGLGRRRLVRVGEIDDVVGPLAHQLGVEDRRRDGAEHPERLVTHLPAVAVRAVEQVSSPALPDTGDVREFIADPRGHHDAAAREHVAASGVDGEAGLDARTTSSMISTP